jgi:D-glycero-alpha-D-manno-heptose-7-phosphate kinase
VPPFATREGGAVVNLAITRYTYASVRANDEATIHLRSDDFEVDVTAPRSAALVYDGQLDLVKAAIRRLEIHHGLDVVTRADAPPGSGLGTSAALGVAILGALNQLTSQRLERPALAALATKLEIEELHIAGGKQDQLVAALGGINFHQFSADEPSSSPIEVSAGTVNELEKRLVLCYSGISRLSGDLIGRVQHAYEAGEPATRDALRTMRSLAHTTREALAGGDVDALGAILQENWRCQRTLHQTITNADVERLFAVALTYGALGGKACGAGGGGCLVFLAATDAEHQLRRALIAAGATLIDFNVDWGGLQTWQIDETSGRVR